MTGFMTVNENSLNISTVDQTFALSMNITAFTMTSIQGNFRYTHKNLRTLRASQLENPRHNLGGIK